MLRSIHSLTGMKLHAEDGHFGKAKEFYFDDQSWTVRYLVADTGTWLPKRKVLLSPHVVGAPDERDRFIPVSLTKKQIEESPSIDSDKPVSRQFERTYYGHYGWPLYWHGPFLWGAGPFPAMSGPLPDGAWDSPTLDDDSDIHLRSTKAVAGHGLQARDGSIGHVEDFVLDDETWAIRYLIIDTRNWLPGRKVLVSPEWIARVSWAESTVFTALFKSEVESAPEYSGELPISREYEELLFKHHGHEGYWSRESGAMAEHR